MTNDAERLFGLNPEQATSLSPFSASVEAGSGTFGYTRRDPSLSGATYSIWTSTDLQNWVKDTGAIQTPGAPDINDIENVSVTISPALLSNSTLFIRIQVTQ